MAAVPNQFPYLQIAQTVGTYPLGNAAVTPRNLYELLNQEYRGENRTIPGVAGDEGYPKLLAAGHHMIELMITGYFESDGTKVAGKDAENQLWLNILELRTAVAPITTGDGTRACTLHLPDGTTTQTADCQVGPLQLLRGDGPTMVATLDVHVPDGTFD